MIRMKSSVLMIALALLLAVSVTAAAEENTTCPLGREGGPGMGRGPGPLGPLGRVAEELGLTDEQKEEIRAIVAEEMPAARQRIEERISGVLTAEQQSKLEELKQDQPAMMRGGKGLGEGRGRDRGLRGPGGPGARLERMAQVLDLTDDQKAAIQEIFAEAAPEKRADLREKINNVLTPEQQEKMKAMHEQRQARMDQRRGAFDEQE